MNKFSTDFQSNSDSTWRGTSNDGTKLYPRSLDGTLIAMPSKVCQEHLC